MCSLNRSRVFQAVLRLFAETGPRHGAQPCRQNAHSGLFAVRPRVKSQTLPFSPRGGEPDAPDQVVF